jgi:hypothetical protein
LTQFFPKVRQQGRIFVKKLDDKIVQKRQYDHIVVVHNLLTAVRISFKKPKVASRATSNKDKMLGFLRG